MSHEPPPLEGFAGTVRLFPLPNLVLFPHVVQPLHIFEPRYRELMADALAGDRLITLALLRPGWEEEYHKRPPLYTGVCVGRVTQEERLPDGRYNLLLHGLARARVLEELPAPKLYRVAHVELLADEPVPAGQEPGLRRQVGEAALPWFQPYPAPLAQLRRLLASDLRLGPLCDILSFALPLGLEAKQALLEEAGVERRARALLARLAGQEPASPRAFPPGFSAN